MARQTQTQLAANPNQGSPFGSRSKSKGKGQGKAFENRLNWTVFAATTILQIGLFADAWAHKYGVAGGGETFFTIWHAGIYGGLLFLIMILVLGCVFQPKIVLGKYWLLLAGTTLFFVGGGADFAWHSAFGFERGDTLDAFYSPPHLMLEAAWGTINFSLLRVVRTQKGERWSPMSLILVGYLYSELTTTFAYLNPFARRPINMDWSQNQNPSVIQGFGVSIILIGSLLMMTVVLLMLLSSVSAKNGTGTGTGTTKDGNATSGSFLLPFGAMTLVLGLNGCSLVWDAQSPEYLAVGVVAGLAADLFLVLIRRQQRNYTNPSGGGGGGVGWSIIGIRLFSFGLPTVYYGLFFFFSFAVAKPPVTVSWSVHMLTGTLLVAGFLGLGLSFLAFPVSVSAPNLEISD